MKKAIILILALGFILSVWGLGDKSFWTDEIFSVYFSRGSLGSLAAQTAADMHPPLYFFLLHCWMKVFGEGEFWTRFLSIPFFILSIFLLYKIGEDLFDRKTALTGAFLCSISPVLILYSRMARYYSLNTFLILLSIFFFLKLREEDKLCNWVIYAASLALILYTDYPSYFYLFVLQSLLLFHFNIPKNKYICAQAASWLLYAPWAMVLFSTTGNLLQRKVDVDLGIGQWAYLFKVFFPLYSYTYGETLYPWNYQLVLSGAAVFCLGIATALKKGWEEKSKAVFVLVCSSFGVAILNAVILPVFASTHSFIYYPRIILFSAFFYVLLVAYGLSRINEKIRWTLLLIIVAINMFSVCNVYRLKEYFNPSYIIPWREAAFSIEKNLMDGDVIFSDDYYSLEYYLNKINPKKKYKIYSYYIDAELKDLVINMKYKRFWLVLTSRDSRRDIAIYGWLKSKLDKELKLEKKLDFVPLDENYVKIKSKIQNMPAYRLKLSIFLYKKNEPAKE